MSDVTTRFYNENADELFPRYRSLRSEDVFKDVIAHVPTKPGFVADIGSGSGRDTKWLAELGHTVISVEPSVGLRTKAMANGMPANAIYVDSALPELPGLDIFVQRFDLIICSAVWMHLDAKERETALSRFYALLSDDSEARAIITFKVAPEEPGRGMHVLDADIIAEEFAANGFSYVSTTLNKDLMNRDDTRWYTTVLYKNSFPAQELVNGLALGA
ncbi:class I SAM-dependent methyltransferase [Rhizobium sp. MHM7A]|uniref:class I SAM-dependent methyltransferase n=1 Tax=Rhizobium sp. MHM7A TaxID=2583233 RepID=UPI0011060067|nr:class I SAM-dependent methyltransferase [Rhizobium sp. MHM7A]TLX16298.1 class I SAM-dependent methyltransferase [Rhizobium sp. MHM7A]